MFIKNSTCNYNAHELLLATSRLVFPFRCMGCTNTYHVMNYYIASSQERKRDTRYFDPLFGVCMITLPLAQPTIMIQFFIILSSLSHRNPPLNIDLIIFISFDLLTTSLLALPIHTR